MKCTSAAAQAARERLELLQQWAATICAWCNADLCIRDLAASFADGAALCHLVRNICVCIVATLTSSCMCGLASLQRRLRVRG